MRTRIKFCGITRIEDVHAAAAIGPLQAAADHAAGAGLPAHARQVCVLLAEACLSAGEPERALQLLRDVQATLSEGHELSLRIRCGQLLQAALAATGRRAAGRLRAASKSKNSPWWVTSSPARSGLSTESDSSVRRPRVFGSTPQISTSWRSSPPTPTPRISRPGADSQRLAIPRATARIRPG